MYTICVYNLIYKFSTSSTLPVHTGACPDHSPLAIHSLEVSPTSCNPSPQEYRATDRNEVDCKSTNPFNGLDKGPQSIAIQKNQ